MPSTINDRLDGISTSVAIKAPCQAVATTNITLSGEQTVGGVAVVAVNAAGRPDRVLCTGQTNPVENGPWDVSTGAWSRAKDFNGNRDVVQGTLVQVYRAAGLSPFYRVTSANPVLIGTDNITFEQVDIDADVLRADLANTTDATKGAALVAGVEKFYESFAAAMAADNSAFNIIGTYSFLGSWSGTTAGPKGGATYHRDNTTGTASTAYADNSGFYDANGDGFRISLTGSELCMDCFGADTTGATASDTAIQNAINYIANYAVSNQGFGTVVASTGSYYRLDTGLTVYIDRVTLDWKGCKINAANMTTGAMWTLDQIESDANLRAIYNTAHAIKNFIAQGPGVGVTAVTAIEITDAASPNTVAGFSVESGGLYNFAKDVNVGSGGFCNTFRKVHFAQTTGTATLYSVTIPSGTNSGERNYFIDCWWNNKALVLSQQNTNATTFLQGCSVDGFTTALQVQGGGVIVRGGHIECSSATGYYGDIDTNVDAYLDIDGVTMIQQASRPATSLFRVDSAVTAGGLILGNNTLALGSETLGTATASVPIVSGSGRVVHNGSLTLQSGGQHPVMSAQLNTIAYGGFESGTLSDEWTLSGTNNPSQSAAQAHSGSQSMLLTAPVGVNTSIADRVQPVKPGDKVTYEFFYLIPTTTGTGYNLEFRFDWLDAGGNVISNVFSTSVTTLVTTWTKSNPVANDPAPPGATHARIRFALTGTIVTATVNAYIDDVIINVL